MRKKYKVRHSGFLFVLPEFLGVMLFGLIPFADVVRRSFVRMADESFIGFSNYCQVLENKAFRLAVKNTVRFTAVCIPLLLCLSLFTALFLQHILFLAEKKRAQRNFLMAQFYQKSVSVLKSIYLLPMAVPAAGGAVLWKLFFDRYGFLNSMLASCKIVSQTPIDWINTDAAFGILIFSYLWKYFGYDVILWLAGLSAIPHTIYEAAGMDGAGKWELFFCMTLPNLKQTAFTVAVLSVIHSFKAFREVYMAAGNYPQESIYLLQHVFNNWFQTLSVDKMAAGSVMLAIVVCVFVLFLQHVWEQEN